MASIHPHPSRENCQRYLIQYRIYRRDGGSVKKSKYAKTISEAELIKRQADDLSNASRMHLASADQIDTWLSRRYLTEDEAVSAFTDWASVLEMRGAIGRTETDYQAIYDTIEGWSGRVAKGGRDGKSHKGRMGYVKRILSHLEASFPDIRQFTALAIQDYLAQLQNENKAPSTVKQTYMHIRTILRTAKELGMCGDNQAELVEIPRRIKKAEPRSTRYVLTIEDIDALWDACELPSDLLGGAMKAAIGLGLYAALRNEEAVWLKWDHVDLDRGMVEVCRSTCEVSGKSYEPKDYERRVIDVKQEMVKILREEKRRRGDWAGGFVIPSKSANNGPMHSNSLTHAFRDWTNNRKLNPKITYYCLRHTHATWCLRSGMDIETLRRRMGHESLATTQKYLRGLELEGHPSDVLPY